jgi:DNA-binding MarR family transcriptional regulator
VRAAKQLLALFPFMGQLWSTAIRTGAGPSGRFKTLGALHARGPIRSGELALVCGTTPSGMTEVIEGLVEDGYVRRVDDPTDRRAVMVALTEAGETELERTRELLTAAMVKIFEGLTPDRKTRLRAAVAEINEILITPTAQKETRIVR